MEELELVLALLGAGGVIRFHVCPSLSVNQGPNLRGGYGGGGGDSPPPPRPTPDFAGHRGNLQSKNVEFDMRK